jgi:hypothetical protein
MEAVQSVKEKKNILHAIKRRKANWIGHIFRRKCTLEHITEIKIEGGIEVTGRQERRHKQLLDNLKETAGYWKPKKEILYSTLWRTRFGRIYEPTLRQTTGMININRIQI